MRKIAALLPERVKDVLKLLRDAVRPFFYRGTGRHCPVCAKSSRAFASFGLSPRNDAQCAQCGALERHRFLWLFLSMKTELFKSADKKMLHVAPEVCFQSKLKKILGENYISADISNSRADIKMDVTQIQYPDETFDFIYCSHVLEHVQDDRRAMREFFRALKNSGWAILLVPISAGKTYEDPSIVGPEERLRAFGQSDHVRIYGPDYTDRLRESGFKVDVIKPSDLVSAAEVVRMGLTPFAGEIYFCTK